MPYSTQEPHWQPRFTHVVNRRVILDVPIGNVHVIGRVVPGGISAVLYVEVGLPEGKYEMLELAEGPVVTGTDIATAFAGLFKQLMNTYLPTHSVTISPMEHKL